MGFEQTDQESDEVLVSLAQMGREPAHRSAASRLLARYAPLVLAFCRRYTRDTEQALDVSQDVLLAAYRALPGFQRRAPFSAWLFAIARNRCLRSVKKPAWTRDEDTDPDSIHSTAPPVDQRVEDEQEERLIERLVETHLEPLERQALILRCVECLSVEEITRTLGIAQVSGARGVLQSARRKLRAALRERGDSR